MAQGSLRTLSLVKCSKITDDGLKRVLERNPRLIKMNVPGCTRLTIEGILKCLKNFTSRNTLPGGIKHIRVGERYDLQHIHFEELKPLIGDDSCRLESNIKNLRYYRHQYSLSCGGGDCAMDIELCPRCRCQSKNMVPQSCRECRFCISRCYQCVRCINDVELEETFCLEPLCLDCWNEVKD
ncbi:hypothetical protein MKW98_014110 [Papaver atlanticum]|uniref:F-box protein SKIP14 n=1 Tax=Papaver atlanticum TaxID=357466 RepID=A0AAD4SK99_9MAGN|nr:hypothetical protein MKW98_014110 [Papaver atlanticum]